MTHSFFVLFFQFKTTKGRTTCAIISFYTHSCPLVAAEKHAVRLRRLTKVRVVSLVEEQLVAHPLHDDVPGVD